MCFTVKFGKIAFSFAFGKESKHHSQVNIFTLSKEWLDNSGEVEFAKSIISI